VRCIALPVYRNTSRKLKRVLISTLGASTTKLVYRFPVS